MFYDNSISPGAKINIEILRYPYKFYDNSISPGAKIIFDVELPNGLFYDNSISPGAKISKICIKYFNTCFCKTINIISYFYPLRKLFLLNQYNFYKLLGYTGCFEVFLI